MESKEDLQVDNLDESDTNLIGFFNTLLIIDQQLSIPEIKNDAIIK